MNPLNRLRGKQNKARGRAFEQLVLAHLLRNGLVRLGEILATPTTLRGGKIRQTRKVLADIVGLDSNGRGVLVECKLRCDGGKYRMPRPSDFLPHQRATLAAWRLAGGLAWVAYSTDGITPSLMLVDSLVFPPTAANAVESTA